MRDAAAGVDGRIGTANGRMLSNLAGSTEPPSACRERMLRLSGATANLAFARGDAARRPRRAVGRAAGGVARDPGVRARDVAAGPSVRLGPDLQAEAAGSQAGGPYA